MKNIGNIILLFSLIPNRTCIPVNFNHLPTRNCNANTFPGRIAGGSRRPRCCCSMSGYKSRFRRCNFITRHLVGPRKIDAISICTRNRTPKSTPRRVFRQPAGAPWLRDLSPKATCSTAEQVSRWGQLLGQLGGFRGGVGLPVIESRSRPYPREPPQP
jgi:hypothetical protein